MIISLHPPAREPAPSSTVCARIREAIADADAHPPRDNSLAGLGFSGREFYRLARVRRALVARFVAHVKGKAAR